MSFDTLRIELMRTEFAVAEGVSLFVALVAFFIAMIAGKLFVARLRKKWWS